jgi:hypothetical protein
MPVIGDVRVLPESLDDSWRQIAEAFAPATGPTDTASANRAASAAGAARP